MPVLDGRDERDREERHEQRLRLVEGEEARLLRVPRAPARPELCIAGVLAGAEAAHNDKGHASELEARERCDQHPVREVAVAERRVERPGADEAGAPAGVDGGRVHRPQLDQVQDELEPGRDCPAEQDQLPPAHRARVNCTSRSARVRNAASQKAR